MNESFELLQKINWFLKPISDIILFLFTTKGGVALLFLLIILVSGVLLYNKLRERKFIYKSATGKDKIPFLDFTTIIFEEFSKLLSRIFSNLTVLIVVIFLLFGIVGLSTTFTTINTFFINKKKNDELKLVVKNLNQRYKVAKVEILDYNRFRDSTTMKVSFFDNSTNKYATDKQIISLPGSRIYFNTFVMNFKYSQIENGEKINIAIPYMVFSEKMTQENGVKLNTTDTSGMPYIYKRQPDDLYGLNMATYNEQMKELLIFMNDNKKAKQAGIRSYYASAPNFVKILRKGQIFVIWIEQTGGLVIKQDEDW